MHLTTYLHLLHTAEGTLGDAHGQVAASHGADADVSYTCRRFAVDCAGRADALRPALARYAAREMEPDRLHPPGLTSARGGPIGLLRDLQDLYQLANLVDSTWWLVGQAAHGARDRELIEIAGRAEHDLAAQLAWLRMRMRVAAPQALLVTPP